MLQHTSQHQETTTGLIEDATCIARTQQLMSIETHKQWSKSPTTTMSHLTRLREGTQHTRRKGDPICHDVRPKRKGESTHQHANEIRSQVLTQKSSHKDSTYNKMIHYRGDPTNIQDVEIRGQKTSVRSHYSQHVLFQ